MTEITLAELRMSLAVTRRDLRDAELTLATTRARAEEDIIDQAVAAAEANANGKPVDRSKALGNNPEERARVTLLRLEDNQSFTDARRRLDTIHFAIDLLTAQIANAEDERRERERLTRQELVDVMARRTTDDDVSDLILDLSHPARLGRRTTDRASDDTDWAAPAIPDRDEIRVEDYADDETARYGLALRAGIDGSHTDVTPTDLGESPIRDVASDQLARVAIAARSRR